MAHKSKICIQLLRLRLWALFVVATIPGFTQAQVPLKAKYTKLTSESCGESTAGGGCVTTIYDVVELRKQKLYLYTESVNNCTSGSGDWVRSESKGRKAEYSYQVKGDTIYLKNAKIRFFVQLKETLYSDNFDFFAKEK